MGELHYALGDRDTAELGGDVRAFWEQAVSDESLRAELADAGVPLDEFFALPADEAVQFRHRGEGIDPTTVALVVAFAPSVNAVVEGAWKEVILPWIRKRRGQKAVGPRIHM